MSVKQQEAARWIAMLVMMFGHAGSAFAPEIEWLRWPGRVSYPVFAYLLALHVVQGYSPGRYVPRLVWFGVLAAVPHALVLHNGSVNILFTLALSCIVLEAGGHPRKWWLIAGAMLVSPLVEFGPAGVLLPVAFTWALKRGGSWWVLPVVLAIAGNWPWAAAPVAGLGVGIPWLVERLDLRIPRVRGLGWYVYTVHLVVFAGAWALLQ